MGKRKTKWSSLYHVSVFASLPLMSLPPCLSLSVTAVLQYAADLLQIDYKKLEACLLTRVIESGFGQRKEIFNKPNTAEQVREQEKRNDEGGNEHEREKVTLAQ